MTQLSKKLNHTKRNWQSSFLCLFITDKGNTKPPTHAWSLRKKQLSKSDFKLYISLIYGNVLPPYWSVVIINPLPRDRGGGSALQPKRRRCRPLVVRCSLWRSVENQFPNTQDAIILLFCARDLLYCHPFLITHKFTPHCLFFSM